MSSPKAVMSLPPLDPQSSTRRLKTVNADEDAGIPTCELDFSVPRSPVSSERSMSSNENKDGNRRGLLQRSQQSLRKILGKPSYKEMTDSNYPVPSEEASSPKEDMNDTDGMVKRSKGSIKKLDVKSSALEELQDDGNDGRNETKDRRSKSDTVTPDTKDRRKHHKRVGSFEQLLGRESGGGSRSNDKGLSPEGRRSRSGDNLDRMRKALPSEGLTPPGRLEGRRSRSGDNLDRMRKALPSEGLTPPGRLEGRRSRSGDNLDRMRNSLPSEGLTPPGRLEGRRSRSGDNLDGVKNSSPSEGQKPPSGPEGRRSRSGERLERRRNSLRPKGRMTRSGDNLDRMRNSLRSEVQKPPSRPEVRKSRSGEQLVRSSNSLRPEGRKTRSGDNLDRMRNALPSDGHKPPSLRNIFRSNSFTWKGQKKEGRTDSKLAQMIMAEFANFED
jgi:hypothetical protein